MRGTSVTLRAAAPARPLLAWCAVPAADEHTPSAARRQSGAARRALTSGLLRLGLVPHLPSAAHRIALAGPGAVRLVTWDDRQLRPAVQFSLAHTARYGVAAVRRAGKPYGAGIEPSGLGVDAEDDWAAAERNLRFFATRAELAFLQAACGPLQPLHLWCAKEAIAKAAGHGFRIPPRRYRLHGIGDAQNRLVVTVDGDPSGPRLAHLRIGTRPTSPPTAWAVAELPLPQCADFAAMTRDAAADDAESERR